MSELLTFWLDAVVLMRDLVGFFLILGVGFGSVRLIVSLIKGAVS